MFENIILFFKMYLTNTESPNIIKHIKQVCRYAFFNERDCPYENTSINAKETYYQSRKSLLL